MAHTPLINCCLPFSELLMGQQLRHIHGKSPSWPRPLQLSFLESQYTVPESLHCTGGDKANEGEEGREEERVSG